MYAAITGDIIASKELDLATRDNVNELLINDFERVNKAFKLPYPFEFLRGDSFQGIASNVQDALKIALLVKCIFKKNFKQPFSIAGKKTAKEKIDINLRRNWRIYNNLDARIAIGIGSIEYLKEKLSLSDGTALQYSGRELEQMKSKGQKISLLTTNNEVNRELSVELKLLDAIIDKWTVMSAEVVFYLLQGHNETEIAKLLDISQSAINQRKRTANWDAIEILLENYKKLIANI